jgi:large subunit ribosomal protein L22
MSIKVKNSNVGIAPRKVRQVCDLIRNKKASDALKILRFCEKKEISLVITKLINSGLAIATASNKYDLDNLVIGSIFSDEGPMLKRIMPRAQGRAYKVRKRTSHITVVLKEA